MAKVTGEINMDIAKQSTSQEILDRVEDIRAIQSENKTMLTVGNNHFSAYTGAKTLLDITGSGALCLLYVNNLYCAVTKTVWIKITIDGQVYLYVTRKNTASSERTMGVAVFSIGFERIDAAGTRNHLMCIKDTSYIPINGFNSAIYPVSSGETTIQSTNNVGLEHAMPNPLRFEQSLKIEIYQSDSASNYSEIIYYLD